MISQIKKSLIGIVSLLLIFYAQTSYAQKIHSKCTVDAGHISGAMNLHISRYGINPPVYRGEFRFNAANNLHIKCDNVMTLYETISFTGPKSIMKTVDSQGQDAWPLPSSAGQGSLPKMGFSPLMFGPGIAITADGIIQDTSYGPSSIYYAMDVVSLSPGLSIPDGNSSVTYNIAEPIGYISMEADYYVEHPALYLDGLTINYILSSCGINAKQGSTINWPALYKSDIVNGTAESKPYSLSLICGDASAPPSPINISFSSTNGFADAANGVVKTNLANLGLKLSWANPALPPLVLDQVNHSTLSGVGDYTVIAKPVKLSNITDALQAGKFDTTVTMNIEFE